MALGTFGSRGKCETVDRRTVKVRLRAARPPGPHYYVGTRLEVYALGKVREGIWPGVGVRG